MLTPHTRNIEQEIVYAQQMIDYYERSHNHAKVYGTPAAITAMARTCDEYRERLAALRKLNSSFENGL